MSKPINVIYLPGLGDHSSTAQKTVLSFWWLRGIKGHYQQLGWADGEPFAPKLARILDAIDKLTAGGSKVALVGTSAGASAALHAYTKRKSKISAVVYVCGKIKNPQTIDAATYKRNPAFKESLQLLPATLANLTRQDKHKILSIRPLQDSSVPPADTVIEGVAEKVISTRGHSRSIAYAITLGFGTIAKFIKHV